MTFGAPRAMTAAGWPLGGNRSPDLLESRKKMREQLGISQDAIVVGIVGALEWNARRHIATDGIWLNVRAAFDGRTSYS